MTGATRSFPLVISAPSGAGKTSLAQALVERRDDTVFSVSATTRPPRPRERTGRDYHFASEAEFDGLIEAGELAEWAVVHGCRYGTLRRDLVRALRGGQVVVLDIDVQGARQIRDTFAEAVLVFVLPPTALELWRRLSGRGSEAEAERVRRLRNARAELREAAVFDYAVVNDDFEAAVAALDAIVTAERRRVKYWLDARDGLGEMVARLDHELAEILERSG